MHDYENCGKPLCKCQWCRRYAAEVMKAQGFDAALLDSALTFMEQKAVKEIFKLDAGNDGVHNPVLRDLLGLHIGKKIPVHDIGNLMDALREMGAPV